MDTLDIISALEDLARREACEQSLMALTDYVWDILDPGEPLVTGWAMDAIAAHLEAVYLDHIRRLLVTVPPGFSKSTLVNVVFPLWVWIKEPYRRFIKASYEEGIPERDNDKCRNIIGHEKFSRFWGDKFKLVHPNTKGRFENDQTGWMMATSVGAKLIGHRGNYVLIDDPNDPSVENQSGAKRITAVRWFRETVPTRLNNMAFDKIIVIQQRLHMEDVAGTALSLEHENYVHLNIPMEYEPRIYINGYQADPDEPDRENITTLFDQDAVKLLTDDPDAMFWSDPRTEPGELAWPERFPAREIKKLKKTLGRTMWEAQMQQRPVPRGGNIIKTEDWITWEKDNFPKIDFLLACLDTAYTEKTQNDPSALVIWGLWHDEWGNPKLMLIYAWTDWLELNKLVRRVLHTCTRPAASATEIGPLVGLKGETLKLDIASDYVECAGLPRFPVDTLLIEGKAAGISVQQEISRLISQGHSRHINVDMMPPEWLREDKISRLVSVSHMFGKETGIIYAPNKAYADAVIDQCGSFPSAAHDDLVDCTSMGLRWFRDRGFTPTREEVFMDEMAVRTQFQSPPPLYGGV